MDRGIHSASWFHPAPAGMKPLSFPSQPAKSQIDKTPSPPRRSPANDEPLRHATSHLIKAEIPPGPSLRAARPRSKVDADPIRTPRDSHPESVQVRSQPRATPPKVLTSATRSPCGSGQKDVSVRSKCVRPRSKVRATSPQSPCDLIPKSMRVRPKVRAGSIPSARDFDQKSMRVRPQVPEKRPNGVCGSLKMNG
jgi:hypothetical protein